MKVTQTGVGGLSLRVHAALRGLSPGYFALVMATGIVSIGLNLTGFAVLSEALMVVTAVAFVILLLLTGWRFVSHRHELVEDFTHPLRGFGFYTFVAAANVLGARLVAAGHPVAAAVLLGVSAVLWLARGYAVPWTTHLGRGEHPIVAAANGTWFMWAVSGQSIAVAAAALDDVWPSSGLALLAVVAWSLGVFLYLVDGVFVAMRLLAYDFSAQDLTPPYWVAAGAAAITVLAGARVVDMAQGPVVTSVATVIGGSSLVMWAVASWLLPGLFAMGWWRHVTHRIPLRYDANLWCIVFPLGMYAVASSYLAQADSLPFLGELGSVWIWVAFAAWLLAIGGMVVHVAVDVLMPPVTAR
ncbi:MAG TPA: tellurite resistance/C4-dicarboxylate transporter family protein [Nocardioidaceae bacterium]|nr:tellurite resistance/C4-dicarboxylate transporter family protein [Nocardioidaceae bacterium]